MLCSTIGSCVLLACDLWELSVDYYERLVELCLSEFVMFVGALLPVIMRSYAVEIQYVRDQASC